MLRVFPFSRLGLRMDKLRFGIHKPLSVEKIIPIKHKKSRKHSCSGTPVFTQHQIELLSRIGQTPAASGNSPSNKQESKIRKVNANAHFIVYFWWSLNSTPAKPQSR